MSILLNLGLAFQLAMSVIPPQEYRNSNVMTVHTVDTQVEMDKICEERVGPLPPNWHYRGCAEVSGQHMFVFNPCKFPDEFFARSMCHEQGHINGWETYHPRGESYILRISPQTNPKK